MITCGNMHQSFNDTLKKWFFNNFTMFSHSFNVLSIHCVTSGSGANFLYKCPISCSGSLRQHGLLVSFLEIRAFRPLLLVALAGCQSQIVPICPYM